MAGELHIGVIWRELAQRHRDRIAIVDDVSAWSYRRFQSRIARVANALRGLGLNAGDRVALLIPDIREYLEADYGIMSAGLVRVPLDPRLTRSELIALLRHAGAQALITHGSFAEQVDGLVGEVESLEQVIGIGGRLGLDYETLLERASEQPAPEGRGEDLATLNFSGGTTGAPKATMLRHRNLATVARNTIRGFDIGSAGVFLNVRPLWPIAQVILMSHLFAGATVVWRRFDPERFATLVEATGATRASLVPTQLVRCLEHLQARDRRLDRLQAIYVGGSRIPPSTFERALELVGPKIGVLYGLTEAPVTCYLPPQSLAADAEHRSRLLHTVDVGELDAAGNLHIVSRLKDVIRSGSSTIIPKEVEDAIVSHPAVAEVAVIGLPDAEWGEAVTAFVVARAGMPVSERELVEHCRTRLAGYKKPRSIRFVASLPRSHYGKVLRAQLIAEATS